MDFYAFEGNMKKKYLKSFIEKHKKPILEYHETNEFAYYEKQLIPEN